MVDSESLEDNDCGVLRRLNRPKNLETLNNNCANAFHLLRKPILELGIRKSAVQNLITLSLTIC